MATWTWTCVDVGKDVGDAANTTVLRITICARSYTREPEKAYK